MKQEKNNSFTTLQSFSIGFIEWIATLKGLNTFADGKLENISELLCDKWLKMAKSVLRSR